MAKTNAQKQADYRKRQTSVRKLRLVQVWIPAKKEAQLREFVATLVR